jgi:hypothetical protein
MLNFATLFDINYLSRGLCLLDSLNKVLKDEYQLFVLALDEETVDYFKKNPRSSVTILLLNDLENTYPDILEAKKNRNKVEYYFTLSPVLPLYILETKDCKRVTTLDADIYFFSSPQGIFDTYDENDILITPHDFSPSTKYLETFGYYNVSFQSFPQTENSIMVLKDWKQKCISWCYDFLDQETGYFADQKYLDDLKTSFDCVKDIDLKTCGRAPWNIGGSNLIEKNGIFMINKQPLIYYHFHHLRIYKNFVAHGLNLYGVNKINTATTKLYSCYLNNLIKNNIKIKSTSDDGVIRYNTSDVKLNLLATIWNRELGVLASPYFIFFFNIKFLKRCYNYLSRKLNGIYN